MARLAPPIRVRRMTERDPARRPRGGGRALVVVALLLGVAILVASVLDGPPSHLPDLALGWPLILYLERAALVVALVLGLGGIVARLWHGARVSGASLPGGPGIEVADAAADSTRALREGVDEDVRLLSDRMRTVEKELESVRQGQARSGEGG